MPGKTYKDLLGEAANDSLGSKDRIYRSMSAIAVYHADVWHDGKKMSDADYEAVCERVFRIASSEDFPFSVKALAEAAAHFYGNPGFEFLSDLTEKAPAKKIGDMLRYISDTRWTGESR